MDQDSPSYRHRIANQLRRAMNDGAPPRPSPATLAALDDLFFCDSLDHFGALRHSSRVWQP